jgi:hypothetical protein
MSRLKPVARIAAVGLGMALLGTGRGAAAQSLPGPGLYRCTTTSGLAADLNFTVGPGEIYTTPRGWRGTMSIHPVSGNILFHGPTPQNVYQGRYSPGPPPQVELLTVTGAASKEAGITCELR